MALVCLNAKRFGYLGATMVGLSWMSVAFSGGCSSSDTPPVMTEAQKAAEQKEIEAQTAANDAAGKSGSSSTGKRRMGVMPP